jgi:hypothetical protein
MNPREDLVLRIRACSLIFLSELERKSAIQRDSISSKAQKRLAAFIKQASKSGCALEDISCAYISGCIFRKKAIYGVNFQEALDLYEKSQLCKRGYNPPSKLYQEIKRLEIKNQAGATKVYRLEGEAGHFVKGLYLYEIAGKELTPLSPGKGSSYTRFLVQEEDRMMRGNPPPEQEIFLREINKHWYKLIIALLRDYKASLSHKSSKTLKDLVHCPFSAEYLSSTEARKDKVARPFTFALDNLHRSSPFRGKINRVDYLNLLRKYEHKL